MIKMQEKTEAIASVFCEYTVSASKCAVHTCVQTRLFGGMQHQRSSPKVCQWFSGEGIQSAQIQRKRLQR
jgi:hypothetical protein